jgi:hypothetical protein
MEGQTVLLCSSNKEDQIIAVSSAIHRVKCLVVALAAGRVGLPVVGIGRVARWVGGQVGFFGGREALRSRKLAGGLQVPWR